jgi:hypothetical protein
MKNVRGLKSEEHLNELLEWTKIYHPEALRDEPFDPVTDVPKWLAHLDAAGLRDTVELPVRIEHGALRLGEAEGVTVRGHEIFWPDGRRLILKVEAAA